jgi:hypothetical protein
MSERSDFSQDLNQIRCPELTGSTACRDELRQSHLAHHVRLPFPMIAHEDLAQDSTPL